MDAGEPANAPAALWLAACAALPDVCRACCGTDVVLQVKRDRSRSRHFHAQDVLVEQFGYAAIAVQHRRRRHVGRRREWRDDAGPPRGNPARRSGLERGSHRWQRRVALGDLADKLHDRDTVNGMRAVMSNYIKRLWPENGTITEHQTGSISQFVPELLIPDFAIYNRIIASITSPSSRTRVGCSNSDYLSGADDYTEKSAVLRRDASLVGAKRRLATAAGTNLGVIGRFERVGAAGRSKSGDSGCPRLRRRAKRPASSSRTGTSRG